MNAKTVLAHRCMCGECDPACRSRFFKPCCGACMDDTPYRQERIVWPLPDLEADHA